MIKFTACFLRREDAERAIENLRKGTDFQWLKANAEARWKEPLKAFLISKTSR
jgi:hypothetical protein